MNYRGETYPTNVAHLVSQAEELAVQVKAQLQDPSCPSLEELHSKVNGKVRRQNQIVERLNLTLVNRLYNNNSLQEGKIRPNNDLKGLYVFGENIEGKITPVYVGISRTVLRRLYQHAWGKKHNECTLAYLIANSQQEISRSESNDQQLEPVKNIIRDYKFVIVPVNDDYNLYFLEVALAGVFKTRWNSFRTH